MFISQYFHNLPITIKQGSTVKATYTYLADGTKIKTINASGVGYDYIGSFKYNRSNSNITLESVATAGGRTYKTSSGYEARYFVTDHLGSTRLVTNSSGTVLEQNDYMPYGDRHANSALAASTNPYLYNGKESQKDFGINYIDSEARFQRLDGAFNSIDPLCEKYYHVSPYAYCAANPISSIDIDGKDTYIITKSGHILFQNKTDDKNDTFLFEKSGKKIELPKYFMQSQSIKMNYNLIDINKSIMYNNYQFNDFKDLDMAFENMAQNTDVEWSKATVKDSNNEKRYVLSTSHERSKEQGLGNRLKITNEEIIEHTHNHPSNNENPSNTDKKAASYFPNAKFYIFKYNSVSEKWEYFMYDEKGLTNK